MRKYILKVIFGIIVVLMLLTGCDTSLIYSEEHSELYTVARNSLVGIRGGSGIALTVLETDDYGRTLFSVYDWSILQAECNYEEKTLGVLISQGKKDNDVYYREDKNYLVKEIPAGRDSSLKTVNDFFSQEELEKLKEENYWGQEPESVYQSLVSTELLGEEYIDDYISSRKVEEAFSIVSNHYFAQYSQLLSIDHEGKAIYVIREFIREQQPYTLGKAYLVCFDANGVINGTSGIEELKNFWNYSEQIKKFKEKNGWEK